MRVRTAPRVRPRCERRHRAGRGRTDRRRFCALSVPALIVAILLATTSVWGVPAPLTLAAAQQQPFKVRVGSFYAASATARAEPFRTREGETRTIIVTAFNRLTIRDLCFSLRKQRGSRPYTLRITIPTLRAANLTLGVDSLDGLGILGQEIKLRLPRLLDDALDPPLNQPSTEPGVLPLQFGNGLFSVAGTLRWVTARGFDIDPLTLRAGTTQAECF